MTAHYRKSKLQSWVRGISGDTTLVILVPGHLDVTTLPPRGSPAEIDRRETRHFY